MKILMVTNGDAEKKTSWSGVPYRVLAELRRQGHHVVCLDLSQVHWLKIPRILFNRVIRKCWRPWRWVTFETTGVGIATQSCWLRAQVRRHPEAERILAFTYCLSGKGIDKPLILIHDWTNGYLQELFHGRKMNSAERAGDERQFAAMKTADKVVSLYPVAADYIRRNVGEHVKFYGNPVNVDFVPDVEASATEGVHSKHILLVGGSTYQENVEYVIQAVNLMNDSDVVIDVIGVNSADTYLKCGKVNFYGYMDRGKDEDRIQYEKLFRNARCVVNIRKGWGGGSSIAEALYRGKPVIVGNYADIVGLYGQEEKFGFYCEPGNVMMLADKLRAILSVRDDDYVSMCRYAHELVKNATYSKFVEEVMK